VRDDRTANGLPPAAGDLTDVRNNLGREGLPLPGHDKSAVTSRPVHPATRQIDQPGRATVAALT
jgi:hypothetical protein